jgi:hypothetical protein
LKPKEKLTISVFSYVTVPVLAGTQLFHVHEHVLVSSSRFLQNAMKPEWRTDTKPIDLSDEEPARFQAYCKWLYTKKIVAKAINDSHYLHFAHLYVLGAKLMDKTYQQDVLTAIIDHVESAKTFPSNFAVQYIYGGTTTKDPAHRLMVDMWAFKLNEHWRYIQEDEDIVADTTAEFANDVIRALVYRRNCPTGTPPWVNKPESYLADIVDG